MIRFSCMNFLPTEMSSLPGGLFACCLTTVFDDTESAIVREHAALVFATLISYRNSNNEINEDLYPKKAVGMGCEWIGHLIFHHKLIPSIGISVKHLHVEDVIDSEKLANDDKIVPCNLMRAYCIILTNILPLKGAGDVNAIYETTQEISK